MITKIFEHLAKGLARPGSHRIPLVRSRMTNRRYTFDGGIEGLEGRLAPSGGVAVVTITVTNQADLSTPTDPGAGSNVGDGTVVVVTSVEQDSAVTVL